MGANSGAPPSPSWKAAGDYALTYFLAVWQAMILGLLLGSAVEALMSKAWLCRLLGKEFLTAPADRDLRFTTAYAL